MMLVPDASRERTIATLLFDRIRAGAIAVRIVKGPYGRILMEEDAKHGASMRTHCKRGHKLDYSNTYIAPSGLRVCLECKRQRRKRMVSAESIG